MFRDHCDYLPIYISVCVVSGTIMTIISGVLCFHISSLTNTLNSFVLNLNSTVNQLNVTEYQEDFDLIAHQIQNITILLNQVVHKFI